ncbi:acylphosphatase [Ostreiculturibacter nitratireducens]|uniref:acylphosphatase n=1 Tax=Ostreiculturibacter nitratireducens TaxID=3075226 RepID=UPI0031B62FC5
MTDEKTVAVRLEGRVQGVWFRAWTQEEALARGLRGHVRNETDGSVTALLSGPEEAVQGMLEALRDGPPAARVEKVEAREVEAPAELHGFQIVR